GSTGLGSRVSGLGSLDRLGTRDPRPETHRCVPPTVMPDTSTVGMPTPTGTDWPSLPHVQRPSDSSKSFPTMVTLDSASGPLPMMFTFFTGWVTCPSSIRYPSVTENTKSPLLMFTCPPLKALQYSPFLTERMISSGVDSPGSI